MKKPRKTSAKKRLYTRRKSALPPCDKWIIGMVEPQLDGAEANIKLFDRPTVYRTYDNAANECKRLALKHNKAFVVFAKKLVVGPSRPPIVATEFAT